LATLVTAPFLLAGCEAEPAEVAIAPEAMKPIGNVSDRFLSSNVEMVEVTGGRFWRPNSVAPSTPTPTC